MCNIKKIKKNKQNFNQLPIVAKKNWTKTEIGCPHDTAEYLEKQRDFFFLTLKERSFPQRTDKKHFVFEWMTSTHHQHQFQKTNQNGNLKGNRLTKTETVGEKHGGSSPSISNRQKANSRQRCHHRQTPCGISLTGTPNLADSIRRPHLTTSPLLFTLQGPTLV